MWYCPIGSIISFLVGWISSWISNVILGEKPQDVDPDLLIPILAARQRRRQLENKKEFRNTEVLDTISWYLDSCHEWYNIHVTAIEFFTFTRNFTVTNNQIVF